MAHAATTQLCLRRTHGERIARWMPALAGLAILLAARMAYAQPMGPAPAPGPAAGPGEMLPQPRALTDIGPRTQSLEASQKVFGTTPVPTPRDLDKYNRNVVGVVDPTFTFELIVNHTRLLQLKEAPFRIQIGDTRIVDYTILGPPTELLMQGTTVGSTTMYMWFGDRTDPRDQTIMAFMVNVLPDPDVKRRLEAVYKALQDEINRAFPDAYVCLTLVGDKLVVSGEVKDAIEASRILQILGRGNAAQTAQSPVLNNPAGGTVNNFNLTNPYAPPFSNVPFVPGIPEGQVRPDLGNYILPGESNIVNLLRIPGEQQVMLKVTLASVNRGRPARSVWAGTFPTRRASPSSASPTASPPATCRPFWTMAKPLSRSKPCGPTTWPATSPSRR